MGIIRDRLKETIESSNVSRYGDTIGIITAYDNIQNTASIKFNNPNGGTLMTANNISLKISEGGLSKAAPVTGQKCWISFLGNSLLAPVITALCDDEYYDNVYSKKTNADQGAYLIDYSINNINIEAIKISPMIEDYTDESGYENKYTNIKDYTNTDSTQIIRNSLMSIDKYKPSEDGITNTSTNSTVKFKSNGDIDVFVDNNTGIRINPKDKSISFFGKELNTIATELWTINVPNVIIKGNLKVTGDIKTGGEI